MVLDNNFFDETKTATISSISTTNFDFSISGYKYWLLIVTLGSGLTSTYTINLGDSTDDLDDETENLFGKSYFSISRKLLCDIPNCNNVLRLILTTTAVSGTPTITVKLRKFN